MMRTVSVLVASVFCVVVACSGESDEAAKPNPDGGGSGGKDASSADSGNVDDDSGSASKDASANADSGVTDDAGPVFESEGCQSGAGLPEGENTFDLAGLSRRFMLRLPKGYPGDRAWPLVFALHGNGGSVSYWDATSGSRNIRKVLENDAILVVAEAINGNWRDYSAPESTWPEGIEKELAYFEEILKRTRKDLCIDNRSIFSMGFSGGGSFSGVLACRRTDIRAIAVGGSVIYFDEKDCVGDSAAWITIGTQEMNSGRAAFRDFFRDRAGCQSTSKAVPPPPCVAYDDCALATPVHYCEHPGGHVWPDFGSQAMWDFFSQFVDT
jgi:poly(3-hydroxybutyrate) depolymerase